jgi:hypothetical protein
MDSGTTSPLSGSKLQHDLIANSKFALGYCARRWTRKLDPDLTASGA